MKDRPSRQAQQMGRERKPKTKKPVAFSCKVSWFSLEPKKEKTESQLAKNKGDNLLRNAVVAVCR